MAMLFQVVLTLPFCFMLMLSLMPFVRRWLIDTLMAPIYRAWTLRGISEILKSETRLLHALSESSRIHPLHKHRLKLARIAKNIKNGLSIQEAFYRSGMIRRSQLGLLALAKEPRQLSWSLHQLAERNFFRWIELYSMLIDVFALLVVILAAAIVGAFAYLQFQVLAYMISSGV